MIAGTSLPAQADPVRQDDPSNTWSADLVTVDDDDTNVTNVDGRLRLADITRTPASLRLPVPEGMLVTGAHQLATPADLITADHKGVGPGAGAGTGVTIEVRGQQADGEWGEWREAGTALSEPTLMVQVRVVLTGADATIGELALTATLTAAPKTNAATPGLTY